MAASFAAVEEQCGGEGEGEEECLMRRTLVAHTDYIYTQGNHNQIVSIIYYSSLAQAAAKLDQIRSDEFIIRFDFCLLQSVHCDRLMSSYLIDLSNH